MQRRREDGPITCMLSRVLGQYLFALVDKDFV